MIYHKPIPTELIGMSIDKFCDLYAVKDMPCTDVTTKFNTVFAMGSVVFLALDISLSLLIIHMYRTKETDVFSSFTKLLIGLNCLIVIGGLVQLGFVFNARLSLAGKICSGTYLDSDYKDTTQYKTFGKPYYLFAEGQFLESLMIVPFVCLALLLTSGYIW